MRLETLENRESKMSRWSITGASGCNDLLKIAGTLKVYVFFVLQHVATMLCLTFDLDLGYQTRKNDSPKIACYLKHPIQTIIIKELLRSMLSLPSEASRRISDTSQNALSFRDIYLCALKESHFHHKPPNPLSRLRVRDGVRNWIA